VTKGPRPAAAGRVRAASWRLGGAALALLVAAAGPAAGRELWSAGDASLGLSGSLRELLQLGEQTDLDRFEEALVPSCEGVTGFEQCPAFDTVGEKDAWQSLTRLRTRLDLQMTEALAAVLVYDHELRVGILDTFEAELQQGFRRDDLVDAEGTLRSGSRAEWQHLLYRGYVTLETERLDVAIGRQRIAWGVGRLWNPMDRFNAIPPLAIQADQSQGVDSIDVRWSLDGFNFVQAVYAPGGGIDEARYALRLHGVVYDTDISLMGGVFEKAPTVGVDFARNLADAALRIEAVYTHPEEKVWKLGWSEPDEPDDFWQVVVSLDYNFDLADGIYALVEHLYNGNALGFGKGKPGTLFPLFERDGALVVAGSSALFGSSRVVTAADHQTALSLASDLSPELRLEFLTLYDWDGQSAAFVPSVRYAPPGALEVSVGIQTFTGPRRSQYGSAGTLVYLLADLYF
jgi:hypothetical protein